MAIYRSINIDYWQDGFILDLTPEEKYFYLYLMTNSKTTQCGIFEVPMKIMETETGYNRETIMKYINRFISYEKIAYDSDTNEILLYNWIKYNRPTSPKVLTCVEKELAKVKSKILINKLLGVCSKLNIKVNPNINSSTTSIDSSDDNTIYVNSRRENKNGTCSVKPSETTNARAHKKEDDSIYNKPSEEQLKRAREL